MPQVVGPADERRDDLRFGQRLLPGELPPPVVDRLGERPTVQAPEEPTVRADPVILDVRAQQLDEPGRDRDRTSFGPPPVLESAPFVGATVIGPVRPGARRGAGEHQAAPAVFDLLATCAPGCPQSPRG